MINIHKINQIVSKLPTNTRMPSNTIIHRLAQDDHAIHLLSSVMDVRNHIAFLVIQPEQSELLTYNLFHSVHCVIVKEVGVLLSSSCSAITEGILENMVKWAPYLKVKEDVQFYNMVK
jgi:hypothetical protein